MQAEKAKLDIRRSLRGERILITGATGFLGKVLVEKLLWSVPDVGKLLLLVRPAGERGAADRLRDEILGSPIMARLRALHADGWPAWAAGKVEVVAGDLARDRFGLDAGGYAALCDRVDRVVACAATVSFDERLDRALELNARGALRALALARDAGDAPLLHVSTCFVSGRRTGPVPERPVGGGTAGAADPDALLATLAGACRRARGGVAPGAGARLVEAGKELAARHGFHDVYTLTKALAERLIERHRGSVPVAILRPAIVESAANEPLAGWIEAVRVADPLLVAYGRGRTRELPGVAGARLELIPVDYVVNALLAALASLRARAGRPAPDDGVRVYQVSSSRNPISLGELMGYAREGFARTPLRDPRERPIEVGQARFVAPGRFQRALEAKRRRLSRGAGLLRGMGAKRLAARLGGAVRVLDHFVRLVEVYRPYLEGGARYQDAATRSLWERLSPDEREVFPFDVAALDWRGYVADVHVPGLVRFALRAESGAPEPHAPGPDAEREGSDADGAGARGRAEAAHSLFELFEATARATPRALALQTFRDGSWLRYSYGQALVAAANVAGTLAGRYRIGRGDRVALWANGSPEWVLAMFALHRLGAVAVPLDPQWPPQEVEQAARFAGAKLICAAPRLAAGLAGTDLPVVELARPLVPEPGVGPLPGAAAPPAAVGPDDLALLVFTSGTTVAPKAVPLSHGNLLANLRDLVPLMRLSRERMLSVLPIHHVFELMVGLLVPLAGASSISYVAEIKPAEISWMMATTRPTVLVAVPRLLELLHGGIRRSVAAGGPLLGLLFRTLFALSRLTGGRYGRLLFGKVHRRFGGALRRIVTGGAALEPGLGRSFELMGFEVAEGYGMTETAPVLTVNPWGAGRLGSVGVPLPGVELELRPLASETDDEVPPGSRAGEVWVRGANVMAGYYASPEATSKVLRDGWLNTGDVGHLDADGYLWLSGRTRDVIVTAAGKNVHPEEVEARYRGLPGVDELAVVGLPEPRGRGERVSAVVVPSPGEGSEEERLEGIRAAIAARSAGVPSYQRIGGVELWRGELPKTTTFKVRRGRLRAALLAGERGDRPAAGPRAGAGEAPAEAPLGDVESRIVAALARLTATRPDLLRPATRLSEIGVDSLTLVELLGELEAELGLSLDDDAAGSLERVGDLFALRRPGAGRASGAARDRQPAATGASARRTHPGSLAP